MATLVSLKYILNLKKSNVNYVFPPFKNIRTLKHLNSDHFLQTYILLSPSVLVLSYLPFSKLDISLTQSSLRRIYLPNYYTDFPSCLSGFPHDNHFPSFGSVVLVCALKRKCLFFYYLLFVVYLEISLLCSFSSKTGSLCIEFYSQGYFPPTLKTLHSSEPLSLWRSFIICHSFVDDLPFLLGCFHKFLFLFCNFMLFLLIIHWASSMYWNFSRILKNWKKPQPLSPLMLFHLYFNFLRSN